MDYYVNYRPLHRHVPLHSQLLSINHDRYLLSSLLKQQQDIQHELRINRLVDQNQRLAKVKQYNRMMEQNQRLLRIEHHNRLMAQQTLLRGQHQNRLKDQQQRSIILEQDLLRMRVAQEKMEYQYALARSQQQWARHHAGNHVPYLSGRKIYSALGRDGLEFSDLGDREGVVYNLKHKQNKEKEKEPTDALSQRKDNEKIPEPELKVPIDLNQIQLPAFQPQDSSLRKPHKITYDQKNDDPKQKDRYYSLKKPKQNSALKQKYTSRPSKNEPKVTFELQNSPVPANIKRKIRSSKKQKGFNKTNSTQITRPRPGKAATDKIRNRLKVSQVFYMDSALRNLKHQSQHLHNTYSVQSKLRQQILSKIASNPSADPFR